jgi:crotonobetainyl-CoA:carnitine CoA-transferase CaiB-like acyl-CoA transferase
LSRALEGVKVVEFAAYAAGPGITKYLADHGATVVHVESRTRPDGFRVNYPPFKDNIPGLNRSGCFSIFNNNKLGVTLNLKTEEGLALAKRLVAWSDVVIENFTPGTMKRLGLDYATLKTIKPDLIMLSTCNQGQTGPHADHSGFGTQLSSLAGFTHLTGYPGGPPMILYGPYIDFVSVAFGFTAVAAALDHRRRTGQGQYIDLSQYETGLQFVAPTLLDARINGRVATRMGNRTPAAAPHGVYPCRGQDRWCALSVWSDEEWERLVAVMGHPAWAATERFRTLTGRKQHEAELDQLIGAWTRELDPEDLMERLRARGLRAGVVRTMPEVFTDPQLTHQGIWWAMEHPEMGHHHGKAPPFILRRSPARPTRPAPCLGEHNREVFLALLGMTEAEFAALEASGAIN